MNRALPIAMLAAALLAAAQTPPAGRQAPAPRKAPQAPAAVPAQPQPGGAAAKPAAEPAVKDLKFPPLKPIPVPPIVTYALANGMKVFLLEDHELPMIGGAARIRTGNLFDPAGKVGLASVTGTTMRTGGSAAKTGEQWSQELENMASSVEAAIGETSGSVSFSTLRENVDATLAIFKDVLTAPEFRQDKIDLAKSQMRSSISRRNDDARGIAGREFAGLVYGKDTPYGWSEEYATVARITRADVRDFHKRYFFPRNTVLAVWGDFDTAGMKARLEKLFADWTVEQPPPPAFPKVAQSPFPGVYLATKRDVTQTFFSIGQLGGEARDKDYAALEVMANILGGGFQSRLFQRVRTSMGAAYDIGAEWGVTFDHAGLFEISGSTKSVSTVETIKAIQEEVARIRSSEVAEEELRIARDSALNSLVFAFDTRTKTLARALNYEYFGYPTDFIQQYQKALAAVTRADVLRVARERLDPANFVIVVVGNPQAFGQPLTALGEQVHAIDLTIAETAAADEASIARGKEALARVQRAVGGVEKLAAVRDFTQTGAVEVTPAGGGMKVLSTDRWLAPNAFRQDQEIGAQKIAAFWGGASGWVATSRGSGALSVEQAKQIQGDLFRLYFRLLLSDRIENRTVSAADELTLIITDTSGQAVQLAIDPGTGLPAHVLYTVPSAAGTQVEGEDAWSDFRDVAGIRMPHKIVIKRNGVKFADVVMTESKVNSGLKLEELQKRP